MAPSQSQKTQTGSKKDAKIFDQKKAAQKTQRQIDIRKWIFEGGSGHRQT